MEDNNSSQNTSLSKYINPEELPSFIPQQLKDLIENNIDAFPAAVGRQIGTLSEFRNKKEWAIQRAAAAKEKANAAEMKEVKWYKSSKDVIEALQQACKSQSEAIEANAQAHQASFQNQQKMAEVSKTLLALGLANSTLNQMIIREITLKLQNASKEELNDLATQELESVLRQLKSQEDIRNRIEKQKDTLDSHEERISDNNKKLESFKKEQSNFIELCKKQNSQALEDIIQQQKHDLSAMQKEQKESLDRINKFVNENLAEIEGKTNALVKAQDEFISQSKEQTSIALSELKEAAEHQATESQKQIDGFIENQTALYEEMKKQNRIYKVVSISALAVSLISLLYNFLF